MEGCFATGVIRGFIVYQLNFLLGNHGGYCCWGFLRSNIEGVSRLSRLVILLQWAGVTMTLKASIRNTHIVLF